MRKNSLIAILGITLLVLFLSACDEIIPNFSDTPKITFDNVLVKQNPSLRIDTLLITVKFQDGDGDLGIEATADTNLWNYYIVPYKKFKGEFTRTTFSSTSNVDSARNNPFIGQFLPVLKKDGRAGPIEGTLTYRIDILQYNEFPLDDKDSLAILQNDTIKVQIYLKDRAGHRSNVVESDPFAVLRPR